MREYCHQGEKDNKPVLTRILIMLVHAPISYDELGCTKHVAESQKRPNIVEPYHEGFATEAHLIEYQEAVPGSPPHENGHVSSGQNGDDVGDAQEELQPEERQEFSPLVLDNCIDRFGPKNFVGAFLEY